MTESVQPPERPILMNARSVRAIMDGRKTQTRRIVKLDHSERAVRGGRCWHLDNPDAVTACPYQPGDVLYVRETWAAAAMYDHLPPREIPKSHFGPIRYRADDGTESHGRWRSSIHMPKWAARLWLRVTDVRAERVQEITTTEDVWAEGVQIPVSERGGVLMRFSPNSAGTVPASYLPHGRCFPDQPPLTAGELAMSHFADLWDDLHGPGAWDRNDWVWVVTFEREER